MMEVPVTEISMEISRGAIETDWDVDTSLVKKIFEETLTKDQLFDLVEKRVKPAHWNDGRVSYFRVHKIIESMKECNLPLKPNLDVALDVLSNGKAKIHHQSHSSFAEFIRSQVENKDLSFEELQMQVECLMPGCYPIGPECESLGITGNVLFDEDTPFPNPLNPTCITNRVILELSHYLSRVKKDHSDMAKWIKKVVALGKDQELSGELVSCWCSSVNRDSSRKKRHSMSRAQQYLAQPFIFFGLDQTTSTKESTESSNPLSNTHEETQKKNGHMEADSDSDVNVTDVLEDNEEMETIKKGDPTVHDNIKSDSDHLIEGSLSVTADTSSEVENEKELASKTNAAVELINEENDSYADKELANEKGDERKAEAMEEPSTSTSSNRKPRAAASAAVKKMKAKDLNQINSPQMPKMLPVKATSKVNLNKRASTKPHPGRKATKVAKGARPSRMRKAHKSSEEEEERESDDEIMSSTSHKRARQWRDSSLARANKDLKTMFAKVKKLKKELKIALEYLEDEASTLNKQLQAVKKRVLKAEQSRQQRKKIHMSSSEDEEGEVEEDSGEDEDSNEEVEEDGGSKSPLAKARNTSRTKKITVQVHPSVKTSLRKPLLQLRSLTCDDTVSSDNDGDKLELESEHRGARRMTRRCATSATRGPKSRHTRTSLDVNSEPLEFDKEKLFSSKACVSLVRITDDVVKKAEKIGGSIECGIAHDDPLQVAVTDKTASSKSSRDRNSKKDEYFNTRNKGRFTRSRRTTPRSGEQKLAQYNEQVSGNETDTLKREVRKGSTLKDTKENKDSEEGSPKSSRATRASPRCSQRKATNSIECPKEGANTELRDRQKSSNTAVTRSAPEEVQVSSRHEKGKKRSLNDFVKMLNSSKRMKGETGKRTSPRRKRDSSSSERDVDGCTSQDSELIDSSKEFGDDDFLENTIKMQLEEEEQRKSKQDKPADEDRSDKAENSEKEKEESDGSPQKEELGGCDPQDDPSAQETVKADNGDEARADKNEPQEDESQDNPEVAEEPGAQKDDRDNRDAEQPMDTEEESHENQEDKAERTDKEREAQDDFPGDAIIGKLISHRCSLGKHGLYKWYEGKVLHKATSSELIKLDEDQFNHLNNLKTIYTVKYDDYPDCSSVALEVEWDEGNLKIQ